MTFYVDNAIVESLLTKNAVQYSSNTTATTLNGTLTLTATSKCLQYLTGSQTGYSVALPNATTLGTGHYFIIVNQGSEPVSIKNGAGTALFNLSATSVAHLYLQINTTSAGSWIYYQIFASSTATGILNYTLETATPFNTNARNPIFVPIDGFSVTPQAGRYACFYNASVFYTTTPKAHYWAFYKAGVQETGSLRQQDTAHSSQTMVDALVKIITVNGSQAIDVRVSCDNTGALTVNARTMLLIRLGSE